MFNPAQAKEENDRINNLLRAEPQYAKIVEYVDGIAISQISINSRVEQIKFLQEMNQTEQAIINGYKSDITQALLELESATGFSKAPGLAHLTTIAANYQVIDNNAVPPEFIVQKITSSVDKVKLNKAIKSGELDPAQTNWLEVRPEYKTLVLER